MKKKYSIEKYRKFKNPKISYIFKKTLVLSIICSKCENEDKKYLKKKNQLRYWKLLFQLKIYNYFETMVEESICQEFRSKNIDETRNIFIEE